MNIGEIAALLAAFLWAASSLLYSRISLPAASLNLAKNVLAAAMMLVHVLLLAKYQNVDAFQASSSNWAWLSFSALIGIAIGDTLYFRSLQILGPRKALMLATFSPVFATLFAVVFLGDVLSLVFVIGTALTTIGVLAVIRDRQAKDKSLQLYPGALSTGVWCGVIASVCQAMGAVCAKKGLHGIGAEEGALIRVFAAAVMAFLYVVLRKQLKEVLKAMKKGETLKRLFPATVMGTWFGIWLCQVAYKNCPVSVSTVLLSTTPLFAIPLVRIFLGTAITRTAVFGATIAVVGVYLVVS
ncbi:MAG: DMT family transporter [Fuerstiella sp.]